MRIFVAGGTGAVGRYLVPALVAAGHEVTATSRTQAGLALLDSQGASGVCLDVYDADAVQRTVAAAAPEAIIHQLTALSDGNPADNGRIRRIGTRNLVDAARQRHAGVATGQFGATMQVSLANEGPVTFLLRV